jgi:hypothetical protein
MRQVSTLLITVATFAAGPAMAQSTPENAPQAPAAEVAKPAPAPENLPSRPGTPSASAVAPQKAATPVLNKWNAQLYGFAELDVIHDTREVMTEVPGNPVLPKATNSYAADHGRTQFSIRNSRVGFRFSSPEFRGMKGSGLIETDFFGNQPNAAGGGSEGGFYNNAGLRVRHAWAKLETPYVDVLGGQTWQLFGWQPYFHPNTVELQGVPGQVYSRTAQLRLSKALKTDDFTLEIAAAVARPPQRDADLPDGQAGVRFALNQWKGVRTSGGTGTSVDPAMIGVSGALRGFEVQKLGQANPQTTSKTSGWGVSIDGLIPIIPGKAENRANALTFTGSYVRGAGIQDMYSGFSNGVGSATAPTTTPPTPGGSGGPLAGSDALDSGLVAFNKANNLTAIQVRSYIVGLQYYTPIDDGAVWLAGTWSHTVSDNAADLTSATAWRRQDWAEAALFWDATAAIRFGGAFGWFENGFKDGTLGHNQRYQFSMWYLF